MIPGARTRTQQRILIQKYSFRLDHVSSDLSRMVRIRTNGLTRLVQFSPSLLFKTVSIRWKKPIRAPCRLSEVSPNVALGSFPMFVWLTMALSCPFKVSRSLVELFLFLRLSPLGDRWCDVLGFVPAGRVSSFSTLQTVFQDANVYLIRTNGLSRLVLQTVFQDANVYSYPYKWTLTFSSPDCLPRRECVFLSVQMDSHV